MRSIILYLLLAISLNSFSQLRAVNVVSIVAPTSYMHSQYYTVEANNGSWYFFFISRIDNDFYYIKSTDKGKTWGSPVTVTASITGRSIAIWYDRWSGINGDLVHAAISESGSERIMYRTVNTASSDALGTQRTPYDSTLDIGTGSNLAMTVTPNGYIIIQGKTATATNSMGVRSTNGGVTWSPASLFFEASGDYGMLFPGFAADANDCIGIYWDISASEISKKLYDWSAGTWSETSIEASLGSTSYGGYVTPFAGYSDRVNNYIALAYWNGSTAANADLKFWQITEGANTAKTDVATNYVSSTSYPASISIGMTYNSSTSTYYVFFGGNGTSELNGALSVYYRTSSDAGTSWSANNTIYPYWITIQGMSSLYSSTHTYPTPIIIQQSGACSLTVPVVIKKINGVSPW